MKQLNPTNKTISFLVLGISIIIVGTFIVFGFNTESKKTQETLQPFVLNPANLVGIWHDSPLMASGWSKHYNFYPSGKYQLYFNSMDCAKTILNESGTWIIDGSKLKLTVIKEGKIVGGTLIPAEGPCITSQSLSGGKYEEKMLPTPRVETYNVSIPVDGVKFKEDVIKPGDYPHQMALIGESLFWKFSNDPTNYYAENEFPEPTGF